MDINKVIEIIREAKKASKCPKGFKYSKKLRSCVPIRKKGKKYGYGVRAVSYTHLTLPTKRIV